MSDSPAQPDAPPETRRPWPLDEDWTATIAGLVLLALILVGAVPAWLVP